MDNQPEVVGSRQVAMLGKGQFSNPSHQSYCCIVSLAFVNSSKCRSDSAIEMEPEAWRMLRHNGRDVDFDLVQVGMEKLPCRFTACFAQRAKCRKQLGVSQP